MIYNHRDRRRLAIIDLEAGCVLLSVSEADTDRSVLTEFKKLPGSRFSTTIRRVCAFDVLDTSSGCVIDKGRP